MLAPATLAEEVDVRQRGRLSLDEFDCARMKSGLIRRVCYDETNRYLLIRLGSMWRQYWNVPEETASRADRGGVSCPLLQRSYPRQIRMR
jgi:hypothetical protein